MSWLARFRIIVCSLGWTEPYRYGVYTVFFGREIIKYTVIYMHIHTVVANLPYSPISLCTLQVHKSLCVAHAHCEQ
jgi:hypothetical protein